MDIHCIQCGKPWDAWGARHGDMANWEYELFCKGAGCPCCEGMSNRFEPTELSHVEFGDEDPAIRINQFDDKLDGKLPKWEEPEPTTFWTCEACGVQVIGDNTLSPDDEDYLQYELPSGAPGRQWYHSHPYHRGEPTKKPTHSFEYKNYQWVYITSERSGGAILSYEPVVTETHVCEFCLEHCEECGEPVCSLLKVDCYEVGYAACPPEYQSMHGDVFCINCLETMCSECGGLPNDCECVWCEKCGDHLANDKYDYRDVESCSACGHPCDHEDDEDDEDYL